MIEFQFLDGKEQIQSLASVWGERGASSEEGALLKKRMCDVLWRLELVTLA